MGGRDGGGVHALIVTNEESAERGRRVSEYWWYEPYKNLMPRDIPSGSHCVLIETGGWWWGWRKVKIGEGRGRGGTSTGCGKIGVFGLRIRGGQRGKQDRTEQPSRTVRFFFLSLSWFFFLLFVCILPFQLLAGGFLFVVFVGRLHFFCLAAAARSPWEVRGGEWGGGVEEE